MTNPNYKVTRGQVPTSLQEAFDIAAKHILQTRQPSMKDRGINGPACTYLGIGCALAPFTPTGKTALKKWESEGDILSIPSDLLPSIISESIYFFIELQEAHDENAICLKGKSSEIWLDAWKTSMRSIAKTWDIDPSILKEES